MKPFAVLLILILVVLAFLISSVKICPKKSSENTLNKGNEKQQSSTNEKVTEPELLAPIEQVPIPTTNTNQRNDPDDQWRVLLCSSQLPNWITVSGWFVAAILAALSVSFLRDQLQANVKSADAAKEANELSRETLEITRRARINITNVEFIDDWAITKTPFVKFTLVNTGEMPATGVFKYPLRTQNDPALETHLHEPNKVGSGDIIDPHTEHPNIFDLTIHTIGKRALFDGQLEWQMFKQGEIIPPMSIGICVSYWDGFGKARLTESWHVYRIGTQQWERIYIHQS